MSDQQIGQGPGNLVPDTEYKYFLASTAITLGQCVSMETGKGSASYSIVLADSNSSPVQPAIGVAAEAIASGAWGKVIVKGYAAQVLCGGSVAAGDHLVPSTTAGTAVSGTLGTDDGLFFGIALSADTGSPVYADAIIYGRI